MAHSVGRWVGLWLGTAAAFRSAPLLPSRDATAKFGRAAARMKFEVDPSLPLFPGAPGPGGRMRVRDVASRGARRMPRCGSAGRACSRAAL